MNPNNLATGSRRIETSVLGRFLLCRCDQSTLRVSLPAPIKNSICELCTIKPVSLHSSK
jgi:hypothetical protein